MENGNLNDHIDQNLNSLVLMLITYFMFFSCSFANDSSAFMELENSDVKVLYFAQYHEAAKNIMEIFPSIKKYPETILTWKLSQKPTIVLTTNDIFEQTGAHRLTIAFANPKQNLIVVDYSTMLKYPFKLETTLQHELCHLILNDNIPNIYRWLDEGIAQWASDGIAEIISNPKQPILYQVARSKTFIPFNRIASRFPNDDRMFLLAYEQSKHFVEYLSAESNKQKFMQLMQDLKLGTDFNDAIIKNYDLTFAQLETNWQNSFATQNVWLSFLIQSLEELLFVIMALLSVYAFIRMKLKKRSLDDYTDDDPDGTDQDNYKLRS